MSPPASARVVVIGAGVGGASVAYHLTERGERDVLVVERAELTSGSTFHSAGLVGQLRADPTLTRMNTYSVELYRALERTEHAPGWVECGGIRLASSPQRLEEIRRQLGWARHGGLELAEISAAQARELFPLIETKGVLGAAWSPTDGYVDPARLCYALAALARAGGASIHQRTRVLGIDVRRGRVHRVRTDRGDVECEVVVNCGGIFAAEIARLVGVRVPVRVPVIPLSHQYIVTQPFLGNSGASSDLRTTLPTLRDPDLLVYYRQEVKGLVMGGYERCSAPWMATANTFDAVPADFNGRLLPGDWERFAQIAHNAQIRVPALADVGIRTLINGPEAFTPDNEFCLGETEVGGFFVAAGFCAHGIAGAGGVGQVMANWIVDGEPGVDLWHMDIRRFGPHHRSPSYTLHRTVEAYETYYDIRYPHQQRGTGSPLRTSPTYGWHAAHGAVFGEKSGWERVDYYAANEAAGEESLRPRGWAAPFWSPAIGAEHHGTRRAAGLFDKSSLATISASGADAAAFLEYIFANQVARGPGAVTYTQALNSLGGIECNVTVSHLDDQEFLIVTGTAFGAHDLGWLRAHARRTGASVRLADVTGQYACFALCGPKARAVLAPLTPQQLSNTAFAYLSTREITVGDVPVRAARVSVTGELGWELYCSAEYGAALWRTVWEAGQPHALVAGGYRAIESLRLEKGYRVWGADIGPQTSPDEAGLGFCVRVNKPGGFFGRDALLAARQRGVTRRLRCLTLDDPHTVVLGGEPVLVGDAVAGRVTSGGYGYTVGHSIGYAYLPVASVRVGTRVAVEIAGRRVEGVVNADPLHDPQGVRIRAGP